MAVDVFCAKTERRTEMRKCKVIVSLFTVMAVVVGFVMAVGAADMININTASKEELMQLEGVGSAIAERIVEYREANGPFEEPEDIMNVKGIGESTYEKNKDRIMVEQPKTD